VAEVCSAHAARWPVAVGVALLLLAGAAAGSDEFVRLNARAALLVDVQTGAVLFERNSTDPLPPASTTKLLTALIALRELSPDAALPVSVYASTMPATKAYLRPGWQVSARDLLYALMLHSANDASVVIAEGVAGSVPSFARLMNATARSLGATDSNFVTPNGLPMANHYTTAHDMALIMHAVLQTPGMRDILSTRSAVIQPLTGNKRRIPLRSTNRMLWRDDLTIIGKTGWTREARHCFVGAGFGNGRQVIVAVLGSNDVWRDVETLVTAGLSEPPATAGRPMWQEAALYDPPVDTAWSRSPAERELAEVVPPVNSRRAARLAALTAPTNAYGRRQKSSAARSHQAQGDAPEPAGGKLHYAVHLGSFRSKARADEIRQSAAKHGYRSQVTSVGGAYRVSVPNFSSREAAARAARALGRALHVDPVVVAATQ